MLVRKRRQIGADASQHRLPALAFILAIKPDRSIPRAVVAIEHPAPIRIEAIEKRHDVTRLVDLIVAGRVEEACAVASEFAAEEFRHV